MRITDAESRVMEALWRRAPQSADELIGEVQGETGWGRATVRTLINRLLNKGAMQSERVAGRHQYRPAVERADYVDVESRGFLERMFGGRLSPLVAHFAEKGELSGDDVRKLKALIEKLDER